jgi:hypothetical protein
MTCLHEGCLEVWDTVIEIYKLVERHAVHTKRCALRRNLSHDYVARVRSCRLRRRASRPRFGRSRHTCTTRSLKISFVAVETNAACPSLSAEPGRGKDNIPAEATLNAFSNGRYHWSTARLPFALSLGTIRRLVDVTCGWLSRLRESSRSKS